MHLRLLAWLVCGMALLILPHRPVQAQGNDPSAAFTLPPGGTATIDFESFGLDFGLRFPDRIGLPPTGVADPPVRAVLAEALAQGYNQSEPKEVQLAVWRARGASGAPQAGPIGMQLGSSAVQPTTPSGATSLIDALEANQVTATAGAWRGVGEQLTINDFQDYFKGVGQFTLENVSGQELNLYMPVGTVFPAPGPEFQSMVGYATNIALESAGPGPAPTQEQQAIPQTGTVAWNNWQLILLALIGFDIAMIGLLFNRRIAAQRQRFEMRFLGRHRRR